jgi:2-dehydro-3-deoxyphosphooctonate aldolase (KDO 8-P synthase)
MKPVRIADISVGAGAPLLLIAGPCVVENRDITLRVATQVASVAMRLGIPAVFKSSFEKANRTQLQSFTGLGREEALRVLEDARKESDLPLVTDVHTEDDIRIASSVVDMVQIPAFLSRQTSLLLAAGKSGKAVNIKKGQFMAPEDMRHAADKVLSTGNSDILLCERGTSFGYHDLIVDMRGLVIMRGLGFPVVMDATHAVQIPARGGRSDGRPEFVGPLACAAAAAGIDALFLEVHPDPPSAKSDAGSQLDLKLLEPLLRRVLAVDAAIRSTSAMT